MFKYDRFLIYPLIIILTFISIFLFSKSKNNQIIDDKIINDITIKAEKINNTADAIYRHDRKAKDKILSLDTQLSMLPRFKEEKINDKLPYSIGYIDFSDEVPARVWISVTVFISKNDAIHEEVRKLLFDLYDKSMKWTDENYSPNKWRRIIICITIPGMEGYLACLDKQQYPHDSSPRIDFSYWNNIEQFR